VRNGDKDRPGYLVPAVDKAIQILEALKVQGSERSLSELAEATGSHKSSVQKILVTLRHHGIVERDEGTKRYSLGLTLADYGRVALNNLDIRRSVRPVLKELMEYSGETAVLGVLQGTQVVIADKREPPTHIRVSPFVGWRVPATCNCIGRALLAWLPQSRIDDILKIEGLPARTERSITDPSEFLTALAATRERGYATEYEDFHEGVNGVAAPVFNSMGKLIAALALGGPIFRMTEEKMQAFGVKCKELASGMSKKL
jgi:DNA-binding IclR family transcriptional regulator